MNDHDRIQALWKQIVRIENTYVHFARQHGLTIAEFAILYECTWRDGLSPSEICKTWSLSKQLVRQGAGRLLEKRIIRSEPDLQDKRMIRLYLTDEGRREFSDLIRWTAQIEEHALRMIGSDSFEALQDGLRRFGDFYEEGFSRKENAHGTD